MNRFDILSSTSAELEEFVLSLGQPKYRAEQIYSFAVRGVPFDEMSALPMKLRSELTEKAVLHVPSIARKLVSALDGTVKYLFTLHDGETIESVLMRYEHGTSVCVSTQVGCNMGCAFCASTIGGKRRDLLASEILGQVIAVGRDAGERVDGVVLMGIGEPLDNYDNTLRFLKLVGEPRGLNIGARHISLSTCGIVPRIYDLMREDLAITLSISLHASTDEARSALMPVNRRYNLHELMSACAEYFAATGRRISFEYALVAEKNDGEANASALASLLKKYMKNMPLHVNLIPVNTVAERGDMTAPSVARVRTFQASLTTRGINATVRRTLGADINASCGQLRNSSQLSVH